MHAILILIFLVSFQPQPTGTISGRVTFEDSGAAATDVVIHCVARGGSPTEQVTDDADGRFLCRVAPGVHRVRAQLSRLDTLYLPEVFGAREPGDEGLGLRVREHARVEVPLVLRRSGTISGRVLDEEAHRSGLPRQRQSRACGRTRGGSSRLKAFRPVPIGSSRSIRRLPVFCRRFPTSSAR